MKKLMNFMFLSCRKSTELVEKKLLIGLSPKEKFRLKFHTSMCDACKKYADQSEELDNIIKKHITNFTPKMENGKVSKAYKEKIIKSLED